METAFRLFAERGFDAVTIAEIAEAADVAVNTIFNHFKTKEDLFFSAFKPPGDSLAERLLARAPGRSPVSCLQEMLAESFDQLEAPTSWPALAMQNCQFRTVLEGSPSLHAQALNAFRKRRMELLTEVSEALAHPLAPDALSRLVANQLLALQDGVVIYGQRVPSDGHVTFSVCNFSGGTQAAISDIPVRVITFG